MKTLPLQLRHLREDRDLLQEQVAERLGIGVNSVSHWENGRRSPRIHHVAAYARLVDRRFVVRRGPFILCDVLDVLPILGDLRRRTGLSSAVLCGRLHYTRGTLGSRESQMRRRVPRLSTLQPYLAALGYTLDLIPAEQELAATG